MSNLNDAVAHPQMFATPQARDFRSGQAKRWANPRRTRNLNDQVAAMWPTPTARDWKGDRKPETLAAAGRNATNGLPEAITSRTGQHCGGQLNPTWVEWLMGWPLGWTDCAASATDRFRKWFASHGTP